MMALSWCWSGQRVHDQNSGFDRLGGDGVHYQDEVGARHGEVALP
jgi:hypothetical protein